MPGKFISNPEYGIERFATPTIWVETDDYGNPVHSKSTGGIVFLPFVLLAFMPLAYPISALIVGGTWLFAFELTQARFRAWPDWAKWTLWIAPALLTFIVCMRIEQRLGQYKLYRWPRAVMRVVLPALLLQLIARQEMTGVSRDPDFQTFVRETIHNSDLLMGTGVGIVVMLVLYWFGSWVRDWWHVALRHIGLRSSKLPD